MKRASVFVLFVVFALAAMATAQIATNTSMPPATETAAEISMAPTNRPSEITIYQERQQVQNVVRQLNDAALRNDAGFFDRALAPDYVVSNSESRKEDRDEIINAHRNGDIKYDAVQIREQNIDVIGETAIEREVAEVRGSYKGRRHDGTYSTSRMWKRLPTGRWQLAAMQVERVK